ncbi:nucleoside recognition domain-containing protein [Pumilibacter muris]|jgi:spore maturation protein B|uniref:nucleoside recognition domain-containing protein n=1 Tax=Pumilibacter muris TaxID=2941510 RepID=UPI00203DDD4D|nr:nucleoside recognition domain-containing protein [Pumilibacter muris]
MTEYIIPLIFLTVLLLAAIKKKDSYSAFTEGSRSALSLMANVFPYLLTIMMAVEVFKQSGVSYYLSKAASPVMNLIGIPHELTELMLIRPLSGAGAIGVLENIFTTYGADSYVGKCASVIYGSSETVFYISTIYFSQSSVKKLGYAIPVALFSTLVGCIAGCSVARFI